VEISDFVFEKRGPSSIWIDPKYATPSNLDLLTDPDRLFGRPDCEIIKDQNKIKVGRLKLNLNQEIRALYLKRYNAFSCRYKLTSLFVESGAIRSLRGAAILRQANIARAHPLAAIETRCQGMLVNSFFLSEEISEGKTADAYWRDNLLTLTGHHSYRRRRSFLKDLAALFASLHAQRIYHNDLKDANILIVPNNLASAESFFLLDLEGVRRYSHLSQRRRIKNLVQLNRTLGKYLRRTEGLFFLKCYLGSEFPDRRHKSDWITKVIDQSRRLDRRKMAEHRGMESGTARGA